MRRAWCRSRSHRGSLSHLLQNKAISVKAADKGKRTIKRNPSRKGVLLQGAQAIGLERDKQCNALQRKEADGGRELRREWGNAAETRTWLKQAKYLRKTKAKQLELNLPASDFTARRAACQLQFCSIKSFDFPLCSRAKQIDESIKQKKNS